jgi:hypothetical protein
MTDAVASDVNVLRRRLVIMAVTVGVCALVALISVVGELHFHIAWMRWVFIPAVLAGFGAQAWLIAGFVKQGRGAK